MSVLRKIYKMNLFFYFVISFIISALGSLPTGLITLTVMQRTVEAGKKAGIMLALGATIMEFVYTLIALCGLGFFEESLASNYYMKVFATIVFFAFGLYNYFKRNEPSSKVKSDYNYFDFGRGILVAAMNVLIIPFWLFIALWLGSCEMIFDTQWKIFIFLWVSIRGFVSVSCLCRVGAFYIEPTWKICWLY